MKTWINIFWLGTKELRSVLGDVVMVVLIIYSFSLAIYSQATATSESVNNASVAIVDEDHSTLSRAIANALYPPYFKAAGTDFACRGRPGNGPGSLHVRGGDPTEIRRGRAPGPPAQCPDQYRRHGGHSGEPRQQLHSKHREQRGEPLHKPLGRNARQPP